MQTANFIFFVRVVFRKLHLYHANYASIHILVLIERLKLCLLQISFFPCALTFLDYMDCNQEIV